MDSEFIDLIYQNDEVVGVAVFTSTGELVENQLSVNDASIIVVSQTISNITSALAEAERDLRGFLLKSAAITLQICVVSDYILVMQLAEEFSANKVEQSIRSIFTGMAPTQASPATVDSQPIAQAAEPVAVAAEQPSEPLEDQIDFYAFKAKLLQLLKRVAPGGIAEKMINETFAAEGVDTALPSMSKDVAIALGAKTVAKIPNKGKRKLIEKEYQLLVQQAS